MFDWNEDLPPLQVRDWSEGVDESHLFNLILSSWRAGTDCLRFDGIFILYFQLQFERNFENNFVENI